MTNYYVSDNHRFNKVNLTEITLQDASKECTAFFLRLMTNKVISI